MYTLRPPAPDLRPFIEHYWFVDDSTGPVDVRVDVYVDARADLIFNLGAPYTRAVIGGETSELRHTNLDAQRLVPIRIHQQGAVRTTGVRFHLGGAGVFTRGPLRPWTNLTPPPTDVFGPSIAPLEAALAAAPDVDAQARLLDAWLLGALELDASRAAFDDALAALLDPTGDARVRDAATTTGVSTRQVERLFARHLGVAPKTVARVVRFQAALRALMRDPGCPLADVAAAAGYFDQAHFVRDFRRMTGGVPRGYRGYYPPEGPSDFAPNVVVFVHGG